MPLMVIAPSVATMPRIERFVQEYDIKVAIHNHGPEDPYFPGPREALPVIGDMDPRVGLCVDLGHTTRTGVDIVEAIAEAGDRVLDVHSKDLRDLMDKDSQCIVGEGAMPMPAIFRQLVDMGYEGYVNLEYEIDASNPLPGMHAVFRIYAWSAGRCGDSGTLALADCGTGVALSESHRSSIWRYRGSQSAHFWSECDRWQHPEAGRTNPTRELPFRKIRPPTHQH